MNIREQLQSRYGEDLTLEALHDQLCQLKTRYHECLEQESLVEEVDSLREWIESYLHGSIAAGEYLSEHGMILMDNIKSRLKCGCEEMQRIDEESPLGERNTGRQAHRLSRAAALAAQAEAQLVNVIGRETTY